MPKDVMGKPLDRDGFLKRAVTKDVLLSDGSVVRIRTLPASMIVGAAGTTENAKNAFEPANLLVKSLCNEDGSPMFGEEDKDAALTVDHLSLITILDAIMDLNGLKPAEGEQVEEAEKN